MRLCKMPAVDYLSRLLPVVFYLQQLSKCVFFFPLQLKIQDVHLRFEDGITNPSHPFAFGVCIKNVSMQNAVNEPVSMK